MSSAPNCGEPTVAGVVLAAGMGRRMGRPKAEIVVDGVRLVDRAGAALAEAGCEPVIAVVQPGVVTDVVTVINSDAAEGQRSSLEAGLRAVPASAAAVALILVDMPGITGPVIERVVGHWRTGRIAVGSVGGRRTHPTVMSPAMWREAVAIAGPDEGARRYVALHGDLVDEIAVSIDPTDLDVPEDLARWANAQR